MKPLTKTVTRRVGGLAAQVAPEAESAKPVAKPIANPVANAANKGYIKWRETHPDLYRERQREIMRKRRAANKLKAGEETK